jgi:hypothetical protein
MARKTLTIAREETQQKWLELISEKLEVKCGLKKPVAEKKASEWLAVTRKPHADRLMNRSAQ